MSLSFAQFMQRTSEAGGLQTDDVLTAFLPLARAVREWHAQGLVAPALRSDALQASEQGVLSFRDPVPHEGKRNARSVETLQRPVVSGLQIVGRGRISSDDDGTIEAESLDVIEAGVRLSHPAYVVGYGSWEQTIEHHDPLCDIFSLGLLLAALSLDLDFDDRGDLQRFAASRNDLFALNPRVHPVIAAVIVEMTALNRHERAADLASLIRRLEGYREQPADLDVTRLPGFAQAGTGGRRTLIKTHLRDRLFELSRRNRLLHFRPTQASVNLTVASVPLVIHLGSIRAEQLFVWQGDIATQLSQGHSISLNKHLRFEDQPYLASALDRLMADARRDRAEFGFAQLRLVIAFLNWRNLKEAPNEPIVSPLLLLPVELTRKKGIRDHYVLEPTATEAEVNPVLRHQLRQLYDLELPESLELSSSTLRQFHVDLQSRIRASEPAVTLRLATEPQIELIHEKARQRLAQFKRRSLSRGRAASSNARLDYSYRSDDFRPLGLQMFRQHVKPSALPQRVAAGGSIDPRYPNMAPATRGNEAEQQTFALREQREGNPYSWDFDLCSVTLGNFNYRKMSLVRDYGALINEDLRSESFDRVFSVEPRAVDAEPAPAPPVSQEWPVVHSDATQRAAVALGRTGRSYIVQGPPGTGKSQTITNLIADYLARGKRVLFVCEKRAAIDVVFHRLRQQGLDELCCLIHDSQADKKSFVQNLKQTYEAWLAQSDGLDQALSQRDGLLKRMRQDLEQLERFDAAMRSVPTHIGCEVRELLDTLVTQHEHEPKLSARQAEQLPSFATWRRHEDVAHRLSATLSEVCGITSLARHPFKALSPELIRNDRPLQALQDLTDQAEALVDAIDGALADSGLPSEHWDTLAEVEQLAAFGESVSALAARGQLSFLDASSPAALALARSAEELTALRRSLRLAREKTEAWHDKLAPADVQAALAQARAQERSVFRFLSPAWSRLKSTVQSRYDFSSHAVRPSLTQVLEALDSEYVAASAFEQARAASVGRLGVAADELSEHVRALLQRCSGSATIEALRVTLLGSAHATTLADALARLVPTIRDLLTLLPQLLVGFREMSIAGIGELLRDLREEADALPDLLPVLAELIETPLEFSAALRSFELDPPALAAACARRALDELYRKERWLPRLDGLVLERTSARFASAEQEWLKNNAAVIRAARRRRFLEHVQLSTRSVTQLSAEEKALKKTYSAGRRELEHEFGKSMRYKSIRDLAAGDSGFVIRDLKPVWLMSPLSVSDTLPLAGDQFDAVIFDEASQIPMEESVPALYRAQQVIIVGDEMQLPPTSFFSSAGSEEEREFEVEEDGERLAVALDADSLLTQAARNLPATLLAWHYRSRSESLIGFSNAAFYSGNLFTVPDCNLPPPGQPTLVVGEQDDPAAHVDALLSRPLSFHLMQASPYENRRNPGEAVHTARLVRELLRRETKLSIGVVAFSEAQQSQIEDELESLAAADSEFAARLEAEYVREEDDQFCGLFVKNLENVQGDERDIILLSICYGPDANGRMLMNFGPINQRGGEKRLNVIFSRARHHMVVVSSIRHHAITNDYNDGAAALKGFLQYAESASSGDTDGARAVLTRLNPLTRKASLLRHTKDSVVTQIARELRARGLDVDEDVGQSRFRCDLAVRTDDRRRYRLGVLVDTREYYANRNVAERCVTRPGILHAFGWEVMTILARDWYHEPDVVLARIERRLRGEGEAVVEDEVLDVEIASLTPADPEPVAQLAAGEMPSVKKRCELVEGTSSKFWEVTRSGTLLTIRFGRIGAQGQTLTKTFDTEVRATRELDKLFAEKLRKGYREIS